MMKRLCTHPNVGAGAAGLARLRGVQNAPSCSARLPDRAGRSARLVIQESGGTRDTIAAGRTWVRTTLAALGDTPRVPLAVSDLVIGTECGRLGREPAASPPTPAIGIAIDHVIDHGGTGMFEENLRADRLRAAHGTPAAATPELGRAIIAASREGRQLLPRPRAWPASAAANIAGGLSTIEEKSIGAYAKSGTRPIIGLFEARHRADPPRPLSDGHGQ